LLLFQVEEAGRVLLALLLKTNGLEVEVARWIEDDILASSSKPPKSLIDCLRSVHQTKWKLVRIRQEQGKSYKEVCTSVIEKCRFLIYEIRPYHNVKKGKTLIIY
jgi:E3 ubiquitin-protein ligase HERC2